MKRSSVVALAVSAVLVAVSACSKQEEKPAAPPPSTPPPLPAVQAIYGGYAQAPQTFDRVPHLSRYYVENNQRIDRACNNGEQLPACDGDRFACVTTPPKKPGTLKDARIEGELPGQSATAKVQLQFGDVVTALDADVVYEGGAWKIDQVRCSR